MTDYEPAIGPFIENFQSDPALEKYRRFVNVYTLHEEDIKAINEKNYQISDLRFAPSYYGGKNVFDFKVGKTSFRIWGEAVDYIETQAKQ